MMPTKSLPWVPILVLMAIAGVFPTEPGKAEEKQTRQLSRAEFEKVHQTIKPQPGESRWMEIAWYPSVWEARQKAAREGKPLFLWAGSGGAPAAGC